MPRAASPHAARSAQGRRDGAPPAAATAARRPCPCPRPSASARRCTARSAEQCRPPSRASPPSRRGRRRRRRRGRGGEGRRLRAAGASRGAEGSPRPDAPRRCGLPPTQTTARERLPVNPRPARRGRAGSRCGRSGRRVAAPVLPSLHCTYNNCFTPRCKPLLDSISGEAQLQDLPQPRGITPGKLWQPRFPPAFAAVLEQQARQRMDAP